MRKIKDLLQILSFILAGICLISAIVLPYPLPTKYSILFFGMLFFAVSALLTTGDTK